MIDLSNGLTFSLTPEHYIVFGDFDSRHFGLHLNKREASTPSEKTVTASLPHAQGVVDLSNLRGVRNYSNREIVYTFYRFYVKQENANASQTTIENLVMREFHQTLTDSFEPNYHYTGKCSGVEIEDDYEYKRFVVKITFDLYPFKIGNYPEGNDLWDPFNFNIDVFQKVEFEVGDPNIEEEGNLDIVLFNASQNTHSQIISFSAAPLPPEGTATSGPWYAMAGPKIDMDGKTYVAEDVLASDYYLGGGLPLNRFRFRTGENRFTLRGIGTAKFTWHKELI